MKLVRSDNTGKVSASGAARDITSGSHRSSAADYSPSLENKEASSIPTVPRMPRKVKAELANAGKGKLIHEKKMVLWVTFVALAGLVAIMVRAYYAASDNDMWWLFATGREIVQNGIPYTNPFSIFEDQGIIIQQWLPAVIDYLVYDSFGLIGIGIMVVILIGCLCVSAFALARVVSEDKGLGLPCLFLTLFVAGCSAYLSVRPQIWSMIAYICVLAVMEHYRRHQNWKVLCFLPVIVLIHVNMHMSMFLMDFIIVFLYLANPSCRTSKFAFKLTDYPKFPIVLAIIAMALCTLCNPYGIRGAGYLLLSYGSASYGNYIMEMQSLNASHYYAILMLCSIVAGACAMGVSGLKKIDFPLVVLFLVSIYAATQHTRNVWLVSLFAFALIVSSLGHIRLKTKNHLFADDGIKKLVGIIVLSVGFVSGIVITTPMMESVDVTDSKNTPVEAVEYMDAHATDKENTKVLTSFDMGGYIEWCGYKVSMDPRPELWNSKISGFDKNYYDEYVDMTREDVLAEEFMSDKDVDYLIVPNDNLIKYLKGSSEYRTVLTGNGYTLFEHVS